jgi:hypothetical protein
MPTGKLVFSFVFCFLLKSLQEMVAGFHGQIAKQSANKKTARRPF